MTAKKCRAGERWVCPLCLVVIHSNPIAVSHRRLHTAAAGLTLKDWDRLRCDPALRTAPLVMTPAGARALLGFGRNFAVVDSAGVLISSHKTAPAAIKAGKRCRAAMVALADFARETHAA